MINHCLTIPILSTFEIFPVSGSYFTSEAHSGQYHVIFLSTSTICTSLPQGQRVSICSFLFPPERFILQGNSSACKASYLQDPHVSGSRSTSSYLSFISTGLCLQVLRCRTISPYLVNSSLQNLHFHVIFTASGANNRSA